MTTCRPCCVTNVAVIDDFSAVLTFYPQQDFVFVVNCPPGYSCNNNFPSIQNIGKKGIPPIIYPQQGTSMSLQGCQSLITRQVPAGATTGQLQQIANQIFAIWAQQQAICNATVGLPTLPTPPTRNGSSINKSPTCCSGVQFTDTITWPNHPTPLIMSVSTGTLPPGIVFAQSIDGSSGLLSGTPTTPGVYNFTITITDANATQLGVFYTFNVTGITNLPPASAMENTAYSYQLNAAGGTAPYTFTLLSGNLPGITLSSSGLLSGTPNYVTAGNYPFTVQITDSTGLTCSQNSTLKVTLRPGPDWTQLVWSAYPLTQSPPHSSAQGQGIQNIATGNLVTDGVGAPGTNPFIRGVAAAGVTYTGPQVTSRIILTLSTSLPTLNADTCRVLRNGVQLANGGYGQAFASGTFTFDFIVPVSVGAVFTIDDASPGNSWASIFGGVAGNLSFTWALVNV